MPLPAMFGAEPCTGSNSDTCPGMNIPRRRQAQAARQLRAQVARDIAEEIGRDDHLKLRRVAHHLHQQIIDVLVAGFDLRDIPRGLP